MAEEDSPSPQYLDGPTLWTEMRDKWRGDATVPRRPQPLLLPDEVLKEFVANYDSVDHRFSRPIPLTQIVHLLTEIW